MRPARLVLAAVVVAAGPMLSACESANSLVSAMENFEIWDSKKKLPGERKPVFPEGVPGVASGVPPEMVRGYREPEQGGQIDPARAAAEAAAADQSKPKPKPKPQRTASKPPPKPQAPPDPYAQAAPARTAAPAPAAAQPAPQAAAPWPAQPQGAQAPAAPPQAAWPGSPGTVAR
jgi:hypothetical protein